MNRRGQNFTIGKLMGLLVVLTVIVIVAYGASVGFDKIKTFFELAIPGFGIDKGTRDKFNLVGYELVDDEVFYWSGVEWTEFGAEKMKIAGREVSGNELRNDFKKFYILRSGNISLRDSVARISGYRFYSELRGLIFLENIEIAGFEFSYKGEKYLLGEDDKLYKFADGKYKIETVESFPEIKLWRDSVFEKPEKIDEGFYCVRRSITSEGNYLVADLSEEVAESDSC